MVRFDQNPPQAINGQDVYESTSSDDERRPSVMKKKSSKRASSKRDNKYERRKTQIFSKMGLTEETVHEKLKRKYDGNHDGVFQEDEVDEMLNDFVDMMTKNESLEYTNDELMRKLRKMSRGIKALMFLSFLLAAGCIVAVYFATAHSIDQGNAEVKNAVDKSVTTSVAMDNDGHALLQDKAGHDLSTRSFGDSFESSERVDRSTGEKLNCIPIESVANMANDVASGTEASLVIKNEENGGETILPVSGVFEDGGDRLHFASGSIRVVMDDDRCNNPANSNLWSRRDLLRRPSVLSESDRADILAKNRQVYNIARTADHRERSLQQGGNNENVPSVPVEWTGGKKGGGGGAIPILDDGAWNDALEEVLGELGDLDFDLNDL